MFRIISTGPNGEERDHGTFYDVEEAFDEFQRVRVRIGRAHLAIYDDDGEPVDTSLRNDPEIARMSPRRRVRAAEEGWI